MIKMVEKTWGREEWIVNDPEYCGKFLSVNPGYQCSLHYHKEKRETFYVLSGRGWIERALMIGGKPGPLVRCPATGGLTITIERGTPHRFGADNHLIILEISTHHEDSDSYRLEESRQIPKSAGA